VKPVRTLLLLSLVCAPAFAQEDPTKPAPTAPAPTPEAKKERKVDPAATKALERHLGLVHLPSSGGAKAISAQGSIEDDGVSIGVNPSWTAEKGFDLDVVLSNEDRAKVMDKLKEQGVPEAALAEIDVAAMVKQQLGFAGINAAFDAPGKNWEHYDVAGKQAGEDFSVELTPFDEKADADNRTYVFGKEGLLKSISIAPKDNTPMGRQLKSVGATLDSTLAFEKKGERWLLVARTLSILGNESETKFTYYEGPAGTYLVKDVAMMAPGQGDKAITFHDYVVDGKPVESTKGAAKPAEKPKEAEKPAAEPTPTPAPKDEPK
jgi:hypothetical protein